MLDMCPHGPGGSVHGPLPKVSLCSVVLMGLNGQLHSAQGGWKFQISHLTKTHHVISHTALTRTQSTQLYPLVLGGGSNTGEGRTVCDAHKTQCQHGLNCYGLNCIPPKRSWSSSNHKYL